MANKIQINHFYTSTLKAVSSFCFSQLDIDDWRGITLIECNSVANAYIHY